MKRNVEGVLIGHKNQINNGTPVFIYDLSYQPVHDSFSLGTAGEGQKGHISEKLEK